MKQFSTILVMVFVWVISGCGGGGSSELEKVVLNNVNYKNAVKAMNTVNHMTLGHAEVISLIMDLVTGSETCDVGSIASNAPLYTLNDCTIGGIKLDGNVEYSSDGTHIVIKFDDFYLESSSTVLYYQTAEMDVTTVSGGAIKKFVLTVTGYIAETGSFTIEYKNYRLLYEELSTYFRETYDGNFRLSVFSSQWLDIQTMVEFRHATAAECPTQGRIKIIGDSSSIELTSNADKSIDVKLNGVDVVPYSDCDAIGTYPL
jgi:hypothetical protein